MSDIERFKELAGLNVKNPRKTLTEDELKRKLDEEGCMTPPMSPSAEEEEQMFCPHCGGAIPYEAIVGAKEKSSQHTAMTNQTPTGPEDSTAKATSRPNQARAPGSLEPNPDIDMDFEMGMESAKSTGRVIEEAKEEKKSKKNSSKKKSKKKSSPKTETNTDALEDLPKEWNKETKETEHELKSTVPANVKKAMKDKIDELLKLSRERLGDDKPDLADFYKRTSDALQRISDDMNTGDVRDFNRASMFATSLMGPMQEQIPMEVWSCLTTGGKSGRSLKDYFVDAKEK